MSAAPRSVHQPELDALLDELLEAHVDTIQMTLASEPGADWHQHALYLQRLVREAYTALATHLTYS